MGYSEEQIKDMRRQCAEYEENAALDPDMANQIVFAMRPGNVNRDMMVALWGEDWMAKHIRRQCSLCDSDIIVRPVFSTAVTVCMQCVPKVRDEMRNPKAIN